MKTVLLVNAGPVLDIDVLLENGVIFFREAGTNKVSGPQPTLNTPPLQCFGFDDLCFWSAKFIAVGIAVVWLPCHSSPDGYSTIDHRDKERKYKTSDNVGDASEKEPLKVSCQLIPKASWCHKLGGPAYAAKKMHVTSAQQGAVKDFIRCKSSIS